MQDPTPAVTALLSVRSLPRHLLCVCNKHLQRAPIDLSRAPSAAVAPA